MKRIRFKYFCILPQVILLAACAPQATATPSAEVPVTGGLVTVDLAGPKMEVGSTFLYADGTTLVAIPGGVFTMGGDGPHNPEHPVNLADFWIYSTKVTNIQYSYCVAIGLCTPPLFRADNPAFDDPLHSNDPMVGVDFDQASAYCSFVHARLPTEAEWEKVARGPNGNVYPWGDAAPSCDLLNYGICVGDRTPVTNYPAGQSYYHAFDMEGNALEWVADWFQEDYYLNAPADNPPGPDGGRERVVRSSAFNSGGDQTPAYTRFHSAPDTRRDNLGFRCVVDDPTYFAPFCEFPATYGTDGIGGPTAGAQPVVNCPAFGVTQDPLCTGGGSPYTDVTYNGPPGTQLQIFGGACQPLTSSPPKYRCTQNGTLQVCSNCTVELHTAPQCPEGYDFNATTLKCSAHPQPPLAASANCLPGYVAQQQDQQDASEPSESGGQCCGIAPIVAVTPDPASPNPVFPICDLDFGGQYTCFCPLGYVLNGSKCESPAPPDPNAGVGGGWHCVDGYYEVDPFTYQPKFVCLHEEFDQCPAGTNFDGQQCISTSVQSECKSEGISLSSCTSGGGDPLVCPGVTCGLNYKLNPNTCQCDCDGC